MIDRLTRRFGAWLIAAMSTPQTVNARAVRVTAHSPQRTACLSTRREAAAEPWAGATVGLTASSPGLHPRAGVVEMRCGAAMEYLGSSLDSGAEHGARIVVTDRARDAIRCLCRVGGPQLLVVACPAGVECLPVAMFSPSQFDVIVGHVAGCPVCADVRQLGSFADRHAVLDVAESMRWRERPLLRLRSAPCGGSHRVAPRGWGRDAVTVAQSRQVGSEIPPSCAASFAASCRMKQFGVPSGKR